MGGSENLPTCRKEERVCEPGHHRVTKIECYDGVRISISEMSIFLGINGA